MVKKKLFEVTGTVNNINNYGVNNGIMAGTIVLPEDSPISFVDNFIITPISNATILGDNKYGYEIKPKRGTWNTPFVGYPYDEDGSVNGSLGVLLSSSGTNFYKNLKTNIDIKFQVFSMVSPVTQYVGIVFLCKSKPSVLIIGDRTNPKSFYSTSLP